MIKKNIALGVILTMIGWIGVASLLTMDIALPPEMLELLEADFSPSQIQLLLLINPSILVLVAVIIGISLGKKTNLSAPVLEKLVGIRKDHLDYRSIVKQGLIGGAITGLLLSGLIILFSNVTPSEFQKLGNSIQPSLATRFLYGGITEEILMRFGLMTLLVWIISKLFKTIKPVVYWLGIVLAALLFAVGHFPAVFNALEHPSPAMITYVLIGNTLGGLVFGWLYWKRGLESAIIAHGFAHVFLVVAEQIFR